jgi:benzoyl-CoA reductase/2-hydroxyglutaryl-CoA dehydratase subunit BcrC/BadD/HgdB
MAMATDTVGITTTVPVEAVFAAGLVPLDLNNTFVSDADADGLVDLAMAEGFPQSSCAWIKGIFGAVARAGSPSRVVGVVRGDCSGTELLLEAFESRGIEVIPFTYPYPPSREDMSREIERLCERLGTIIGAAEKWREELAPVRGLLAELDRACWEENVVTGAEAHLWLVSSSDFNGEPETFARELASFLDTARRRKPLNEEGALPFRREIRLGYIGVPPVTPTIFESARSLGARFVFHEVQRQFSMPPDAAPDRSGDFAPPGDIVEQYLAYTYPYTVAGRASDINRQARVRGLDGIVHYVQSFCHRNLEDVVFRRLIELPMLTVECDCPGMIGATALARLENFIQVIGENQ